MFGVFLLREWFSIELFIPKYYKVIGENFLFILYNDIA